MSGTDKVKEVWISANLFDLNDVGWRRNLRIKAKQFM